MLTDIPFQINKTMYPLDGLIEKYGLTDYIRDYYAGYMLKHTMMPYVMISEHNTAGKNLQHKLGSHFAKNLFYFFAKGPYVLE